MARNVSSDAIVRFCALFAVAVGLIAFHWLPISVTIGGTIILWIAISFALAAFLQDEDEVED